MTARSTHVPYEEAGVSWDDLVARGFLADVTPAMIDREQAAMAKVFARGNPTPSDQGDLFSTVTA